MFIKTIFWKINTYFLHVAVTGDLGDDAGGGDFFNEEVAFFERSDVVF